MSRATAEKLAATVTTPDVRGSWDMEVDPEQYPQLAARLDCIEITAQLPGESHDLIFGKVKSPPPVTAYALDSGEVRADMMTFTVSLAGTVYTFTGPIVFPAGGGMRITCGTITPPPKPFPGSEEGSWSAQAQG